MDSPFPLDSDRSSELLAALDTLRDNMNKGDMEHDLVLEVLDTPDRLATRCRANDSSRTSGMVIDLDGEFVDSSSDWKAVPAARIDAHYQRSSNVCEVLSHNTAQDNNNCIRMKGSLTKTLNNKHFLLNNGKVLDSEQEESLISAGLCQQISSPISHPASVMDLRRKKGKEVLSQRKSVMTGGYTGLLEELSQQNSSLGKMEHGSSFSSEVVADIGNEERDKGKSKQIDIGNDLQGTSEEGLSRQLLLNRPQRNMTQKRLVRNDFISPHNIAKSNISSKVDGLNITKSCVGETCSLHRNVSGQDYKKGNYMQISSDGPTKVVTRRTGHRKLVRNGHISANNIGHSKNVTEGDIIGDTVSNDFSDGNSSVQVHIINSDSKNGWSDRRIGNEKLYANIAQNVQQTEAEPQLDRECLKAWREDTSVTAASDTLGSAKIGPMASRDHKGKASTNLFIRSDNVSKRGETVSQLFDQTHENEIALGERDRVNLLHDSPEIIVSPQALNSSTVCASVTSESESESGRQHRRQKQKAKRKCNAARPHFGECSSLPSEDPENSYIQSSTRASNPKSIRCHETKWNGELLGPGFEVDKINFPSKFQQEGSNGYDGSNAWLSQVESDEILARQLQEQFYHELPGSEDTEEIDASIAWSLQQQEDARHVASTRRNRSHPRDASMAHLFVHGPRPSFQTYSQQLANHARSSASSRMAQFRRNFNSPEIDLEMSIVAELRRNFNSGEMDLDTRLNLLEALEAAFESSEDMEMLDDTLVVQRDITEDDYEMLLALDDNNYQHSGASESQIGSLPESVIQSNSNEEACAICLEPPAVGDVIRHLPCMHKFHKECIDTWLRRRTSCPVCKSGIS